MAIAPTAPPQQPQAPQPNVVQNAAMATTPQGGITPTGQNFDSLKNDWMAFLQRPEVISGMLQFGASALAGSNVGTSLAEAAQAASGTREAIQQRGQQGLEESNRQRAAAVQERGAAVQEKGIAEETRANIAREQQALQASKVQQEQFAKTMGLEFGKLGLEKQRADMMATYYANMSNAKLMAKPGYAQGAAEVIRAATLAGDPGTPEYDNAFMSGMTSLNRVFGYGATGPGSAPEGALMGGTPGGATAAPQNGGPTGALAMPKTQQELVDQQIYATSRGNAKWDAATGLFQPVPQGQ